MLLRALLRIKASFHNQTDLYDQRHNPVADHPLSSWADDPSSDCCRRNRVMCNNHSGHVIKLHLQDHSLDPYNFSLDLSLFQTLEELRSLSLSNSLKFCNSLIHAILKSYSIYG